MIWVGLGLVPACAWLESLGPPSQAQLKALETRTLDAPFDAVYAAATEALFDLGYQVTHSDKGSGIVVGERKHTKTESIPVKDTRGNWQWIKQERTTTFSLTLLIKSMGKKVTDVRIKTAIDGAAQLNKSAINEVWMYIDRQVLMNAPAPSPKRAAAAF